MVSEKRGRLWKPRGPLGAARLVWSGSCQELVQTLRNGHLGFPSSREQIPQVIGKTETTRNGMEGLEGNFTPKAVGLAGWNPKSVATFSFRRRPQFDQRSVSSKRNGVEFAKTNHPNWLRDLGRFIQRLIAEFLMDTRSYTLRNRERGVLSLA